MFGSIYMYLDYYTNDNCVGKHKKKISGDSGFKSRASFNDPLAQRQGAWLRIYIILKNTPVITNAPFQPTHPLCIHPLSY